MVLIFTVFVLAIFLLLLVLILPLARHFLKSGGTFNDFQNKKVSGFKSLGQIVITIAVLAGISIFIINTSSNVDENEEGPIERAKIESRKSNEGSRKLGKRTQTLADLRIAPKSKSGSKDSSSNYPSSKTGGKKAEKSLDSAPENNTDLLPEAAFEGSKIRKDIFNENPEQDPIEESSIFKMENVSKILTPMTFEYKNEDNNKTLEMIKEKKIVPPFAFLKGSREGDFFIINYFDQVNNGNFIKSEDLRIINPYDDAKLGGIAENEEYTIYISLKIPALKQNESLQLPLLLNSIAIPSSSDDTNIILNETAMIKSQFPITQREFSYTIARIPELIHFYTGNQSEWLGEEFFTMPYPIHRLLMSAKNLDDESKLSLIAAIMKTYFGYQSGIQKVVLPEGKTWNTLLSEHIDKSDVFIADCDVLCMFSFIYLKYLGFDPTLILGFFNLPPNSNTLTTSELHSTIFLNKKGVIFEPTIFTEDFTAVNIGLNIDDDKKTQNTSDSLGRIKYFLQNSSTPFVSLPEITQNWDQNLTQTSQIVLSEIKFNKILENINIETFPKIEKKLQTKKIANLWLKVTITGNFVIFIFGTLISFSSKANRNFLKVSLQGLLVLGSIIFSFNLFSQTIVFETILWNTSPYVQILTLFFTSLALFAGAVNILSSRYSFPPHFTSLLRLTEPPLFFISIASILYAPKSDVIIAFLILHSLLLIKRLSNKRQN
ncbi:MAG: hypothetical protein HQL29_01130 [Candidatus Omnitrophica bacterium]|nr:hypothetical protein [Candidatus Omnitrophota bacterium]